MAKQIAWFGAVGMAALTAIAWPGSVAAQTYPERPITIVVSASVGGSIDGLTRQLAPFLAEELGTEIIVENKEGAGGIVGVRYFLEQPADGYTILVATEAHITSTIEKTGTISVDDFALINMQQYSPTTWYVLESSPYQSLSDLIKEAQAQPDTITYGSIPTGNSTITGGVVEKAWNVDLRFVPQEGGAAADTAILGGHIDVKVGTAGDSTEVEGIRAIAVAAPERLEFLPDTPTFNEVAEEFGFVEMPNIGTGRVIAVHASLKEQHPEIFERLAEAYSAAFHNPEYQTVLETTGQMLSTSFSTPDEATAQFRQLVQDSIKYKAEYTVE